MYDQLINLAMNVGEGNPGALNIIKEILSGPDRLQIREDLQMLKDLGITGSRLYMAYSDIKSNYLRVFESQPADYINPFKDMTIQGMLTLIRNRDATYFDHLNRNFAGQGEEIVKI